MKFKVGDKVSFSVYNKDENSGEKPFVMEGEITDLIYNDMKLLRYKIVVDKTAEFLLPEEIITLINKHNRRKLKQF